MTPRHFLWAFKTSYFSPSPSKQGDGTAVPRPSPPTRSVNHPKSKEHDSEAHIARVGVQDAAQPLPGEDDTQTLRQLRSSPTLTHPRDDISPSAVQHPHPHPSDLALPLDAQMKTLERFSSDIALQEAQQRFLLTYPQYRLTWPLDIMRQSVFSRLEESGEAYLDYMGASLYPESLVRVHHDFLRGHVLGNTHSQSNSSQASSTAMDTARREILDFFDAPPGYKVIFTANASTALKLVGESFPFTPGSSFILGVDSHNSVHGIRQYATRRGANVSYIPTTAQGGLEVEAAESTILKHQQNEIGVNSGLFALTAQSNVSNSKNPLHLLQSASSAGLSTLLDAAALVPTSRLSLKEHPLDAMAISFYKMFGYPTGAGALIARESFLALLARPWFAGGNIDFVQVPGLLVTRAVSLEERFEDGTVNYLTMPAITEGLRFLAPYLPLLPLRLSCLTQFLVSSLERIRHQNDSPVVRVLSRKQSKPLCRLGDQDDQAGFIVCFVYTSPSGKPLPLAFIEYLAQAHKISLRTGCMCNPGAAFAMLGIEDLMSTYRPELSSALFQQEVGQEGIVRLSLGLASSFSDVWRAVRFSEKFSDQSWVSGWMGKWKLRKDKPSMTPTFS